MSQHFLHIAQHLHWWKQYKNEASVHAYNPVIITGEEKGHNFDLQGESMKVALPKDIASKMAWWRMGCRAVFPAEYIEFHKGLAEFQLEVLKELGYTIHRTYMGDDGWMDGMKVLFVIVEWGELLKLKWNDGNQGWMRCLLGGRGAVSWKPPTDYYEAERKAYAEIALKAGRYQL